MLSDLGLNVKLIGNYHEIYFWTTELPFRLYGIEKINKHPHDCQDLVCDIAIVNFPFDCKVRLPRARVQLCLHMEQPYQYNDSHVGMMDFFDGGLSGTGALSWWQSKSSKPHFGFDFLRRWDGYYRPATRFERHGVVIGGQSPHRNAVVRKSGGRIRYLWGWQKEIETNLACFGIGYNIHSDGPSPKTETGRIGLYLNHGLAVVSEPLDDFCPDVWRAGIPQASDITRLMVEYDGARQLAQRQRELIHSIPGSTLELDRLFLQVKSHFNL